MESEKLSIVLLQSDMIFNIQGENNETLLVNIQELLAGDN